MRLQKGLGITACALLFSVSGALASADSDTAIVTYHGALVFDECETSCILSESRYRESVKLETMGLAQGVRLAHLPNPSENRATLSYNALVEAYELVLSVPAADGTVRTCKTAGYELPIKGSCRAEKYTLRVNVTEFERDAETAE